MRDPEEYEADELRAIERCNSAWADKVDTLEKANMELETRIADLEAEVERVAQERDEAKERFAQLVETVSTRTDQRQSMADPRDHLFKAKG